MLIVAIVLFTRAAETIQSNTRVVHIPALGRVSGVASSRYPDVDLYYNIPYAKAPVGDLRWMPPIPHGTLNDERRHTKPGPVCMQPSRMVTRFSPRELDRPNLAHLPMSEDCLTLNVAAPHERHRRRPVMVFIHGGGFTVGGGANYPADALVSNAHHEIVVVTFNYRLGVFGFLGSRALATRSFSKTGNYGIDDQRLALRWVQAHIDAFGGDPAAVTIFGESAGGFSGLCHLVQPESYQGSELYQRVIIQSGTADRSVSMAVAEAFYGMVLNATGCMDVRCLVELDTLTVASAWPGWVDIGGDQVAAPVIDGITLPADARDMLNVGHFNKAAPVIIGHTRDELGIFLPMPPGVNAATFREKDFDAMMIRRMPSMATAARIATLARIKELYVNTSSFWPADGDKSYWWWAAVAAGSDAEWGFGHCSVRRVARMIAKGGSAVFGYVFEHAPQQSFVNTGRVGWSVRMIRPGNDASTHLMELDYVFGDTRGVAQGEAELASKMGIAWASFAVYGTPGIGWTRFQANDDAMLHLDIKTASGIRSRRGYRNEQCDFWDGLFTISA
jgi:para-nitrobenzyl esterase